MREVVEWLESEEGEEWSESTRVKMHCGNHGSTWFACIGADANGYEYPTDWYRWEVVDDGTPVGQVFPKKSRASA